MFWDCSALQDYTHSRRLTSTDSFHTPPRWPSGKAAISIETDLGSIPAFTVDLLPGRVVQVTLKLKLQWSSSSSAFQAISLGFTIFWWAFCTCDQFFFFLSNHRGSHIPSSWMSSDQRWDCLAWYQYTVILMRSFCLNVAARSTVWAGTSMRYTSMLLGRYATSPQQQHPSRTTTTPAFPPVTNIPYHLLSTSAFPAPPSASVFPWHHME